MIFFSRRKNHKEKTPMENSDKVPSSWKDYEIPAEGGLEADEEVNKQLHKAGLTNSQAQLVYQLARERLVPMAEKVATNSASENELAELVKHYGGEAKWQQVASQIDNWGKQNLPDEAYEALSSSAKGVRAMEAMMQAAEPKTVAKAAAPSGENEEDLRRMISKPEYWRDQDPALIKKVSEGFKKL